MLAELLALDVFQLLMVFTRLGAAMMIMPGFGGNIMPSRFRLILALAITLVVAPVVAPGLPAMPQTVGGLAVLLVSEVTIGLFLGLVAQVLMAAVNVAGTVIGFQSGFTNAFVFDAVTEQQSNLLTGFMGNLALVVIFATDLHHLMLRAVVDSYALFPSGAEVPLADMSDSLARGVAHSFAIGLKLSAPLLVFALVFQGGMGVLARLMPQMPVFFVALPVQMMVGMAIFMVTLPPAMLWFLRHFEDGLLPYVGR